MIGTGRVVALLVAMTIPWGVCASVEDDMIGVGKDRFRFSLGSFGPAFNTELRVAAEDVGPGDEVDLEDDLDLKSDDTSIYLSGGWRFRPKHRIFVSYFDSTREGEATATDEIQIGDEVYPAGASLRTELSLRVMPINYNYSLKKTERSELAVTGGLHWNAVKLRVEGSASAGAQDVDAEVEAKVNAPMPLLGMDYQYAFTPRWHGGARGEVFWFDFAGSTIDVGGTIVNVRLSTDYWITRNMGLGAAVNYFQIDLEAESDSWDGDLKYGYFGPQIYVVLRF